MRRRFIGYRYFGTKYVPFFFDYLTLEDWISSLSRNQQQHPRRATPSNNAFLTSPPSENCFNMAAMYAVVEYKSGDVKHVEDSITATCVAAELSGSRAQHPQNSVVDQLQHSYILMRSGKHHLKSQTAGITAHCQHDDIRSDPVHIVVSLRWPIAISVGVS
jgi:hypothetical protein